MSFEDMVNDRAAGLTAARATQDEVLAAARTAYDAAAHLAARNLDKVLMDAAQ